MMLKGKVGWEAVWQGPGRAEYASENGPWCGVIGMCDCCRSVHHPAEYLDRVRESEQKTC